MKFILGQKVGMSQMFDKEGKLTPVTLVLAGPCYILQKKNKEKDGYEALQLGFEKIEKKNKITKSMKGKEYRHIKECPIPKDQSPNVGDEISVATFAEGEKVKVTGMSKGKGFQGGVKRHGFKGKLSATHGNKHEHRTIGSTGRRFPQHVMKGRKMPGRMGFERTAVKNLKIMKIDKDNNLLVLKGAIPGPNGSLLEIKA
jgi:large subunit ribosomal protein L3